LNSVNQKLANLPATRSHGLQKVACFVKQLFLRACLV
jgi:hypothetical protein